MYTIRLNKDTKSVSLTYLHRDIKLVHNTNNVILRQTGRRGPKGDQGDPATNIVTSVNGNIGDVVLDTTDLADFNEATMDLVAANLAATGGITIVYDDPSGVIEIGSEGLVSIGNNIGSGAGLVESTAGGVMNIKSLLAGNAISITELPDELEIASTLVDTDGLPDTATNRYTNDTDITRLANTSGTNTGDQDLSSYATSSALTSGLATKQPLDADLTTLAGLTATTDNFIVSVASAWASRTPAQVKTTLSLNNVDNTSDANKPVSTAQATADGLRVLKAGDTMTGSLAITGGSLTLNNASANRLYYGNIGVAGPSTSSAGQKIQLYGTAGTVNASDYAIGIEAGNIWVSAGTGGIKFYRSSGATLAMEMNSSGNFRLGSTAAISSKLTFDAATTAAGGILFGTDTTLYRSAADYLKTDDKLIADGGLAQTGLTMSPESTDACIIPYYQNDIAYNRLRGGATRVYYDGVLQVGTDANTDNLFTSTSTAFNIGISGITTVVIEIDMCVSLSFGTKIGYAANDVWRAKDIIVEAYTAATGLWNTVASVTNVAYGEKYWHNGGSGNPITKLRFTFSNFATAGGYNIFRVGTIYTNNYAGAMGSGFFFARDGGSIYGDITLADGVDIATNTTTGTKIGMSTTQKLGFWNATPIVQPINTVAIDDLLVNTGLRASGGTANFTTAITSNGIAVPTISSTSTLTNKRITKRVGTVASSATPTPSVDSHDMYTITALAVDAVFGAPTGTPADGDEILIRVKDNGTARALSFNAIYRFSSDLVAPTTTVISKTLYMKFIYNSADTKFDCVAWLNNF